jgi:MoxR-like ATPase
MSTQINLLINNINEVIKGKNDKIKKVLTVLVAGGHILMEDNPGTGKTVLARTIAGSIGSNTNNAIFKRVQFTPDLLPMDLLGTHIFDDNKKDFIFKKGPLFCNILLADEINRASPKVQSALLECMAENQISIGDATYSLEDIFFVIATQNPVEMEGTYPLPAAQLDRFFMKINMGYPNEESELAILNNYSSIHKTLQQLQPVVSLQDLLSLQAQANDIFIHPELVKAVYNIIQATRNNANISLGASTRSGIAFIKCLKAYALLSDRNFVTEDDVKQLAMEVIHHRLEFKNREANLTSLQNIVNEEINRLTKLNLNN